MKSCSSSFEFPTLLGVNKGLEKTYIHMTVGNFDGLHLGHQRLLNQVLANQKKYGGQSCVYTFCPHPRQYFNPQFEHVYLQDREGWKKQLENNWSIDFLIEENFTKIFAETPATEFLDKYWKGKIPLKTLVVGEDFRFGQKRMGDVDRLRNWCVDNGVELFLIPPVEIEGVRVSTTIIRDCLVHGDVHSAEKYLGRHFSIDGVVEVGQQKGRLLGFPTLNMIDARATLLRRGVYLTRVKYEGQYWPAITNVGIRPTIHAQSAVVIESHVLKGLNESLYGRHIEVEFVSFVREEKKFGSLDELKAHIASDAQKAKDFFKL
jgi:riboflavin kinase/FMN adenylyltransferase